MGCGYRDCGKYRLADPVIWEKRGGEQKVKQRNCQGYQEKESQKRKGIDEDDTNEKTKKGE